MPKNAEKTDLFYSPHFQTHAYVNRMAMIGLSLK